MTRPLPWRRDGRADGAGGAAGEDGRGRQRWGSGGGASAQHRAHGSRSRGEGAVRAGNPSTDRGGGWTEGGGRGDGDHRGRGTRRAARAPGGVPARPPGPRGPGPGRPGPVAIHLFQEGLVSVGRAASSSASHRRASSFRATPRRTGHPAGAPRRGRIPLWGTNVRARTSGASVHVVQAAEHRLGPHGAAPRRGARHGWRTVQAPVGALGGVVAHVLGEHRPEVRFVQREPEVEAVVAQGAHHPFGDRVRLGGTDRREDRLDAQPAGPRLEVAAVHSIAVADEV